MRTNNRGFSLLEGVFSMFITFLVLASLVYTLQQAGTVKSNSKNLNQITEVSHTLVLIKSDVRAALQLTSPSSNASGSTLTLSRVNPRLSFRERIDPDPGTNPHQDEEQITVRYSLVDGLLQRRVTEPDDDFVVQRLVRANDFQVRRTDGIVEFTLEVENSRVKKRHSMKVAVD